MISKTIGAMKPVSLKETVERAALLDRMDTKFLLTDVELAEVLKTWRETYQVLEIGGSRVFKYASTYLDTSNFDLLRWHLQGRRNRAKCRVRTYVDSNEHMLEVKVKGLRGQTVKYRRPTHSDPTSQECSEYLVNSLDDAYDNVSIESVVPALKVDYQRITLIAPDFSERITLDHGLSFTLSETGQTYAIPDNVWIAEKKSGSGTQSAECPLKLHGHRPINVSKYVLGMTQLKPEIPSNHYLPIVRKLERMSAAQSAA